MLSELLVVIAIMAILAGISFVGVSTYIRSLQTLEMDETAKEMFIAAQNHLSSAYASGEYEEELKKARDEGDDEVNKEFGIKLEKTDIPDYIVEAGGDKAGEHEYRVITHSSLSSKNKILNYMLPMFAISNEVADQGNYMIVYEANSGTVLSVFYSGTPHTGFGGQSVYTFNNGDVNSDAIKQAIDSKDKRKNFTGNTVIGYFGGKNKDIIPGTKLEPLILSVSNGNKLTAIIQNPNFDSTVNADNSAQIVTLTITGKTSGNYKTFKLTNDKRIEFDLDDISTPNKHFYDQFVTESHNPDEETNGPLIPGEDFEAVAWLRDNSRFANPIESNHVIDNSLFNSFNRYEDNTGKFTDDGIVLISNIRHLENLDPTISNFSKAATDVEGNTSVKEIVAKQSADIDYSDFLTDCGNTIYNGSNTSIQNYYGIYNTDLKEYDGTSHAIKNINSTGGNGGNSGIIGTVGRDTKKFEMKNLDIVDCSFEAEAGNAGSAIGSATSEVELDNIVVKLSKIKETETVNKKEINIKSANGCSGGLIGVSSSTLKLKNIRVNQDIDKTNTGVKYAFSINGNMDGDEVAVDGYGAGGFVGKVDSDGTLIVENSHVDANNLSINGNNAGGIVGAAMGDCTINDTDVEGDALSTIGNTSGGIVGLTKDTLIINKAYVLGKSLAISGNFAGGIAGYTASDINITDTFSTAYVYAVSGSEEYPAPGIAGGFIGSINNATKGSIINKCYVSGHTDGTGKYGLGVNSRANADERLNNFNIIANFIAGGFIGDVDGSTSKLTVSNSYTTASTYSTSYRPEGINLGIVGGFVGKINGGAELTVDKVYSAGLISIDEKVTVIGGFIGTIASASGATATDAYYLKGQYTIGDQTCDFNNYEASSEGPITNVTATSGKETDILVGESNKGPAEPWDEILKNKKYSYKTVAQLSGATNTLYDHMGDWVEVVEAENESNMFIRNAEKLAVIFKGKDFDGKTVSVMVEGLESGKTYYTRYKFNNNIIEPLVTNDVASDLYNHKNDLKDFNGIAKESADGGYDYYIFYDDITKQNGTFAHIFDCSKPGEDICITAKEGEYTSKELENFKKSGNKGTLVGITNSLFADGSNNATYKSSDYYNDVNPDYAIVAPDETNQSAYSRTALITNFRHLQNLDKLVSNFSNNGSKDINKVLICKDLYWKPYVKSGMVTFNQVPTKVNEEDEYFIDFLTAITNDNHSTETNTLDDDISIYKHNSAEKLADIYSFFGIENNFIKEFDGQNHVINNLYIDFNVTNKERDGAGLFREIEDYTYIHNLYLKEPVIRSYKDSAGALIGEIDSGCNDTITIENVCSYGKYSIISAIGSDIDVDAGGLIGRVDAGKVEISNCGASSYVYAVSNGYAGGFIGYFDPDKNASISNCFVGGHVSDEYNVEYNYFPDYVKDDAITGDSLEIINEGGYNVCGKTAAGGFIGVIKTEHVTATFNNCFTTASVNSINDSSDLRYSIGGFIGEIKKGETAQTYSNCYAAGRIFDKAYNIGGFIGKLNSNRDVPHMNDSYVLQGYDYNNKASLKVLNTSATYSGVDFINSRASQIVNDSSYDVIVKTFNLSKARNTSDDSIVYPYKSWSQNHTGKRVFYGDWVEPSTYDRKIVDLENGNILKANILSTTETRKLYPADNTYYETYIRIYGKDSKSNVYFRVLYKNGSDSIVNHINIYNPEQFNEANNQGFNIAETCPSSKAIYDGETLIFNIDDISKYNENYHGTMNWYGGKAGEDIIVYVNKTLTAVMSDSSPSMQGNSLFAKLDENKDGSGTYTAYISNARNLQNLDPKVSDNTDYKIRNVVQTDNIFWKDDGTFGTENNTAKTKPYLTEIPDASIYETRADKKLTAPGQFMSIYMPDVQVYDGLYEGKIYTLYNFNIGNNEFAGNNAGLFAKLKNDLTIKNLYMKNPTVDQKAKSESTGCLVGSSDNYNLNLDNIALQGEVKVTSRLYAGGAVGKAKNIVIKNLGHIGTMDVSTTDVSNYGHVGGMVGRVEEKLIIDDSYLIGSLYNLNADTGRYTGGIVGYVGDEISFKNCKIDTNALTVKASTNESNVGGFVGYVGGNATIDASLINVKTGNITSNGGNVSAGGYIGSANGVTSIKSSLITGTEGIASNLNISSSGTYKPYAGGLVGIANSAITLTDVKIEFVGTDTVLSSFNVNSTGNEAYSGGFVGHVQNSIICKNSVLNLSKSNLNVISSHVSGGLFGSLYDYAEIKDTCIKCNRSTFIEGSKYVGGVIGSFEGHDGTSRKLDIENVFNYTKYYDGHIKLNYNEGDSYVGGFIGRMQGVYDLDITKSFSSVVVEAEGTGTIIGVGGFSGNLEVVQGGSGEVSGCYVSGHYSTDNDYDLKSNGTSVGGFSGTILGNVTLSKCWTTTVVKGTGNTSYVGGFAGKIGKGVNINDGCYTVGKVTRTVSGMAMGQFIGYVTSYEPYYDLDNPKISEAYYVDRYLTNYYSPSSVPSIGGNEGTFTNGLVEERTQYPKYRHIKKDYNTTSAITWIYDEKVFPVGSSNTGIKDGYPFKNFASTEDFYGEWDYNFYKNDVS